VVGGIKEQVRIYVVNDDFRYFVTLPYFIQGFAFSYDERFFVAGSLTDIPLKIHLLDNNYAKKITNICFRCPNGHDFTFALCNPFANNRFTCCVCTKSSAQFAS